MKISYSKWMYHHFSLAIGRPKKWHIRAFQYMKDRDTNTDTGVKIYWRCENCKCKQFFFCRNHFLTKLRLNFDVIRRIFDQLSYSTKQRSRQNVISTKCCVRPNVVLTKWFSTKCHGSSKMTIFVKLTHFSVRFL